MRREAQRSKVHNQGDPPDSVIQSAEHIERSEAQRASRISAPLHH